MVTAQIVRQTQLHMSFRRWGHELQNWGDVWKIIVPLLYNVTMTRFKFAGPGWSPLSPRTIENRIREGTWRAGVGSGQPILQRYGYLRGSFLSGGAKGHVEKKSSKSLEWGTNLKKARYLQGDLQAWIPGAPRSAYATKLPPRPFVFLDTSDVSNINTIFSKFVESKFLMGFGAVK